MSASVNLALLVLPHRIGRKCAPRPQGLRVVSQAFPFCPNTSHLWGLTAHHVAFSHLREHRCKRMGRTPQGGPRTRPGHCTSATCYRVGRKLGPLSPYQHPTAGPPHASYPFQCFWWPPTACKATHTHSSGRQPRLPQLQHKSGLQT